MVMFDLGVRYQRDATARFDQIDDPEHVIRFSRGTTVDRSAAHGAALGDRQQGMLRGRRRHEVRRLPALPEHHIDRGGFDAIDEVREGIAIAVHVPPGKAVRTPLRTGVRDGLLVEVIKKRVGKDGDWEDLTGAEEVVAENPAALTDGQPVTVGKKE